MRTIALTAAAATLVSLAACAPKTDTTPAAEPAAPADSAAAPAENAPDATMTDDAATNDATPDPVAAAEPATGEECYASEPTGGSATLDRQPGVNNNPTLRISFTVTGRTAGDSYALEYRSSEEMAPPNYVFDLVRSASGGAQVITPGIPVSLTQENLADSEIGTAKIMCGGASFYEIPVDELD